MNIDIRHAAGTWLLALTFALTGAGSLAQEFDHSHQVFDGIVKAHVRNGRVDYRALKARPQVLNR